jgi:hypothetical protein
MSVVDAFNDKVFHFRLGRWSGFRFFLSLALACGNLFNVVVEEIVHQFKG